MQEGLQSWPKILVDFLQYLVETLPPVYVKEDRALVLSGDEWEIGMRNSLQPISHSVWAFNDLSSCNKKEAFINRLIMDLDFLRMV